MQRILYKIDKEWDTGIINIQEYADMIDLVHKDYYDILYKYTESEYTRARKIAEKKVDRQITRMVTKSKKDVPIKINKIEEENGLWGTIPETRTDIEHMTFVASDKTLERVKVDKITKTLHKGYTEGLNGKEVGRHIRVEFSKLKGYEAERIARTELHSAHEKGLLDQYKDMNVKYKQWDAHIDSRTRDEHIHLNGEITTLDGTFSNGLKHPGDKNGSIKEWISCRCTSGPYLMPIGKQAPPGATHFREEDLVDVDVGFNLDDYTLEDAITGNWGQATPKIGPEETIYERVFQELVNLKISKVEGKSFKNFSEESFSKIYDMSELQNLGSQEKKLAFIWSGDSNEIIKDFCNNRMGNVYQLIERSRFKDINDLKKYCNDLFNLIKSLPEDQCLPENTLLFRGITVDRFNPKKFIPGEINKFDEFTSTSYDVSTAYDFSMWDDDDFRGWIMKIHAPKGTQGIAIDGKNWGDSGQEYEYLLNKSQKYKTISVNKKTRIIEILLV